MLINFSNCDIRSTILNMAIERFKVDYFNFNVRLVTFIDAGNVYGPDQSFDPSHMRYSGGIELRVNVPMFGAPLRFIYAENLDPLDLTGFDQERFKSFDFSIGTAF